VEETQPEEPQPEVPQPEDISADVHEQTTDPAGSIISSVVFSIQTSTAPPQGNTLSMKSLPINLLSLSYEYLYFFLCRHSSIGNPSRSAYGSIGIL